MAELPRDFSAEHQILDATVGMTLDQTINHTINQTSEQTLAQTLDQNVNRTSKEKIEETITQTVQQAVEQAVTATLTHNLALSVTGLGLNLNTLAEVIAANKMMFHGELRDLQGGASGEHYHLTLKEWLNMKSATQGVDVVTLPVTIPTEGWTEDQDDTTGFPWHIDIVNAEITESMIPSLTALRESLSVVDRAGMCPFVETRAGALRVWSREIPEAEVSALLTLTTIIVNTEGEGN